MALPCPDETVYFQRSEPIEIYSRRAKTYSRTLKYERAEYNILKCEWHQIIVDHKGKTPGKQGMRQILNSIFEAVEGEQLFPVAYRNGQREDRFLVRQCQVAIDKLFARRLKLLLSNGLFIYLKVQFNVAEFIPGHIMPIEHIKKEINFRFENLEHINNASSVLNLSRFEENFRSFELVVYLGNRSVLKTICNEVFANAERFNTLSGIMLSDNGITEITPLQIFNGYHLSLIDLRNNKLNSIQRLCTDLKGLRIDNLLLSGNPLTKSARYPDALKPLFTNIKAIDNAMVNRLSKDYTPMDDVVDVEFNGHRIEMTNKADLAKYETSDYWHALMIPDSSNKFNKDSIADIVFENLAPNKYNIYLCYYKFRNGEHQFLVRDCFEALKYFVEKKNLELDCPKLTDGDGGDVYKKSVNSKTRIYVLMNVASFQMGHIEPESASQKLLNKRFDHSSLKLNLDNIKCNKGMNIIFNTKSTQVIKSLLSLAARQYTTDIRELILSNNKISCCDFTQTVANMKNLRSVDLSNNLIERLSDIKPLHLIELESLNLNGNPICSEYTSEHEYISDITKCFPHLSVLDTVNIVQMKKKGGYTMKKNYLSNHDDYDFVEEFVSRYFEVFESKSDRYKIQGIYHSNVMLTISFDYVVSTETPLNAKRTDYYALHARCLNSRPAQQATYNLHVGRQDVLEVLMSLPSVKFDFFSFNSDSTILTDNFKVITIRGVFIDMGETIIDPDILMAFTRTFCLKQVETGLGFLKCTNAYQIINEHYRIYMPTENQVQHSFKYIKTNQEETNEMALTKFTKRSLIAMMHEVTNLKMVWCARLLRNSNWNYESALKLFIENCQKGQVHDAAFT